ncbi:hypothetical protein K7X08_011385 [Anisodus acutangulus]|uniref:Uncharacterized protein n=1 Tax=Anisodus acutangulus TaxID=402998 RepID=A0A9Q1MNC6_9SOLA|nr:hypothetical protein K7X08_011385 [Anisodus acutangulus]
MKILAEVKKLLVLAGPLMSVKFSLFSLQVISVMFVGHLGELSLSGASMATSFASVTGLSLLVGLLKHTNINLNILFHQKVDNFEKYFNLNTCWMVYMIPLGLSGATSVRVSNELGPGRPQAARLAACTTVFLVATEGIVAAIILISVRKLWGYCYSTEEEVVGYVAKMLLLIAGFHFLDGIQSVLSGTARGCGWQKIGAIINLGAYYLFGIPAGVILAFVYHFGGKDFQGLWLGITLALFAQALLLLIVTLRINRKKEA